MGNKPVKMVPYFKPVRATPLDEDTIIGLIVDGEIMPIETETLAFKRSGVKKMPSIKGIQVSRARSVVITIDHLPDADLSPNARIHWAVHHRAVKAAQEEIGWLAKVAIQEANMKGLDWGDKPMTKARLSYVFHFKDHRKRDLDNLMASCKAYQDGLIEAGVIFYDDAAHLEIGNIKSEVTGHEEIIVTVEEL